MPRTHAGNLDDAFGLALDDPLVPHPELDQVSDGDDPDLIFPIENWDNAAWGATDGGVMDIACNYLWMVDNLLDTTRLEEGKLELQPEPISLFVLAEAGVDELHERALSNGIAMHMDVPENLEVDADRTTIETVLRNLLDNAIKACIAGRGQHVWIGARESGAFVEITVKDDGLGFPPEDAAMSFEKFYRLEGPGVVVFKPTAEDKDSMFYLTVDALITALEDYRDQESVCEVLQGAIRRAEQIDPSSESLFLIQDENELALVHYKHDDVNSEFLML